MSDDVQSRESLLGQTFVRLADSLVTGFDVVELLDDLVHSAVRLLDLAAAGIMLADQRGFLRVMAASSDRTRTLELLELQNNEGPCLECFHSGHVVIAEDAAERSARWPVFSAQMDADGYGAVYALPMHLRDQTIGAVNLFRARGSVLTATDLEVAQALSDVATIAIMSHRAVRAGEQLAEQLQTALASRVAIEQAKGALAEHAQADMSTAFEMLRGYARRHRQRLTDVASAVAAGQLSPAAVVASEPPQ